MNKTSSNRSYAQFDQEFSSGMVPATTRSGARARKVSQNREGSTLRRAVMVLCALIMIVCLAALGIIGYQYASTSRQYDQVAQDALVFDTDNSTFTLGDMTVDWSYLSAINPDVVAWIYVPGTNINYPVVQGDNDEQYLTTDFYGESTGIVRKGSIFLSAYNRPDFSDQSNFLYGHNMNDKTMFAEVAQMLEDSQDSGELTGPVTVYVLTPRMNYQLEIFAIDWVDATEVEILQYNFADDAAFDQYVADRLAIARAVNPNANPANYDKLFGLITCGDDYAQTRVVAFCGVVDSAAPGSNAGVGVVVDTSVQQA